jgi:class 3 adenylate cyclase
MPIELKPVVLVLADISGYTQFVTKHEDGLLHAEQIVTELLEAVIGAAEYPLTLNKLEGDAAFLYALTNGNDAAAARDVAKQVESFVKAFNTKEADLVSKTDVCNCQACRNIDRLRLKVILHVGQAAFKQIRQFEELAGEDVILVHRLLKNSLQADEYILMTEKFFELSGGVPGLQPEAHTEAAEGLGQARLQVFYPPTEGRVAPPAQIVPMSKNLHGFMTMSWWGFILKQRKHKFNHLPERA